MTTETSPSNDEPAGLRAQDLPVPALKIQQYRNFDLLEIERLARVNLITGQNNVGKSSLLEAIHLVTSHGADHAIFDVLKARNEHERQKPFNALVQWDLAKPLAWSVILRSYAPGAPLRTGFVISVPKPGRWLSVRVGWYRDRAGKSSDTVFPELLDHPESDTGFGVEIAFGKRPGKLVSLTPSAAEEADLNRYYDDFFADKVEPLEQPETTATSRIRHHTSRFCPPHGVDQGLVAKLWNEIVLSPQEEQVVQALRLIDPRVQRCAFMGEPAAPHVLLEGMDHPLPLASLGDGMGRLFNIAVLLVASRNGVVCIDDIDLGLHYTVLEDFWRFVLTLAEQVDVQVFATTHSRESIEAFAAALANRDEGLGQVIKLYRAKAAPHRVQAASFGPERLDLALSSDLEVR